MGHKYTVGRGKDCDFKVLNIGVSRKQLEIAILTVDSEFVTDVEYKTPLSITILSRAKTVINGKNLKLSKNSKEPLTYNFTQNKKIIITFSSESDEDNENNIQIEWFVFCVLKTPKHEIINKQGHIFLMLSNGIDVRSTNDPFLCTHLLLLNNDPLDELMIVVLRIIPVFGLNWILYIIENKNKIDLWFSSSDQNKFIIDLFNMSHHLRPNSERLFLLKSITCIMFEKNDFYTKWIKTLSGKVLIIDLKKLEYHGDDLFDIVINKVINIVKKFNVFFMVSSTNTKKKFDFDFELLKKISLFFSVKLNTPNDLWESVMSCSISNLNTLLLSTLDLLSNVNLRSKRKSFLEKNSYENKRSKHKNSNDKISNDQNTLLYENSKFDNKLNSHIDVFENFSKKNSENISNDIKNTNQFYNEKDQNDTNLLNVLKRSYFGNNLGSLNDDKNIVDFETSILNEKKLSNNESPNKDLNLDNNCPFTNIEIVDIFRKERKNSELVFSKEKKINYKKFVKNKIIKNSDNAVLSKLIMYDERNNQDFEIPKIVNEFESNNKSDSNNKIYNSNDSRKKNKRIKSLHNDKLKNNHLFTNGLNEEIIKQNLNIDQPKFFFTRSCS